MWAMSREAYGDDYPDEVQPWGMTTWFTLGRYIAGLKIGPGAHLVDLACGRGGVGLWLARATGARLTGVDWSPGGVRAASGRASEFVPKGRAAFVVGDLTATGLDDECADAMVCADAVFFASDRIAVFREAARVLRPGARFAFTASQSDDGSPASVPDWTPIVEAGGLIVEDRVEVPNFARQLQTMYSTWLAHLDDVRSTLDDETAQDLEDEATTVGPTLATRVGMLYVARKP
jgi:ubiquinone/menaquinone biosynthesis C-methylase UbiE